MKLRLATLILLSMFPLAGSAQTLPSLIPPQASQTPLVDELLALKSPSHHAAHVPGSPVLPIWSGANGKLLAVVALPREWTGTLTDATPAYGGPSAWQLAGSSAASAGGVRWQLGNGFRADAMLGQYAAAPGNCTVSHCGASSQSLWMRNSLTGSLGMGWAAPDSTLDVSYGLSWLQTQGSGATINDLALGAGDVPVLSLPGLQAYGLDAETSVYARGRWQFDQGPSVDVGASYGRGRLSALGNANAFAPGIDLDQLSLSLGLDAGSLRGAIVGHVLRSDDPVFAGKRWTTLDLGVSWRTPWSGELSVGAQNLLNTPSASPRDAENAQSRTPYIQYRQDL